MEYEELVREVKDLKQEVNHLKAWRSEYVAYQKKKSRIDMGLYLTLLLGAVAFGGLISQGVISSAILKTRNNADGKTTRLILNGSSSTSQATNDLTGIDVQNAYLNLIKQGTATNVTNGYNSFVSRWKGSGWTGAAASDVFYGIGAVVTNSNTYDLSVLNSSDAKIISLLRTTDGGTTYFMDMNSHKISNVTDPTAAQDAATKNYVDTSTVGETGWTRDSGTSTVRLTTSTDVVGIGTATPTAGNKFEVDKIGANTNAQFNSNLTVSGTSAFKASATGNSSALIEGLTAQTADILQVIDVDGSTVRFRVDKSGNTEIISPDADITFE